MNADATAFAVLGLKPDADRKSVEAAYKALIKIHHPDRTGGDPDRAAEINRAYRHLRDRGSANPVVILEPKKARRQSAEALIRRPRRRRWGPLLILGSATVALIFTVGAIEDEVRGLASPFARTIGAAAKAPPLVRRGDSSIDAPLDGDGIDRAVASAVQLLGRGNSDRLASQSRRCHRELRRDPDAARLDRCVAFDEAVVALLQRDPLEDAGPFSASAVMARQITGARMLSDDSLAIDSRLGEIRARVDFLLAPAVPEPTPAQPLRL